MKKTMKLLSTAVLASSMAWSSAQAEDMRIALVVKALGIGFFEAAAKGAEEAAAELGDVEIIYTGPTDTTAEGQIEVCLLYTSPSPRDATLSRMPSSA